MSKRFSTLDTTRLIFEHPKILFRIIERMDRDEARFVRENDLAFDVLDYARKLNKTEQVRIRTAFSTDNLFRSGLVIDIVKASGERRLVFQDALLNLMRACNASLYQELTDARLRGHLVTLRDVHNRLAVSSFNEADPDFTELRDDLSERVSQLIGLLRQNVFRMQTISGELADLSGDASRAPEEFSDFRQNLFEQIVTLYERHIKPTLVFLNPDTRLADGANLFATLEAMGHLLEQNDQTALADELFRSAISLNALHKPIKTVATEVDHFLRKTRRGMAQYNAMEHFFGQLRELKDQTETLNLAKKWLDGRQFARTTGFVVGLKGQHRPRHYSFGESSSYYQLLFSELSLRLADLKRRSEVPVLEELANGRHGRWVDVERIRKLYQWLETMELRPTRDLVRELHGRLDGFIEGYGFPDLLAAVNHISHSCPEAFRLITTNRFATLAPAGAGDEDELFIYRKRRLEKYAEVRND
jgi:predicted nuclease with TOPRIM domain